ncbi:Uncharacterized conserved protein YabE, contains G5 and tandem DUF348 domains [Sanguibacter gelidistatuariae]|uniref:Uncharacterized conserved protein YabE, contains G5 and tandem DUF348 domains n=1 Tax=Sanguibacter gelidistatuariae TaxID=1814289 RepID=A0A1G6Q9I1_9MICO|nr:ubiquitin-like domain-containing protein [Sanguibacter gelidistatuariae]SDC88317.1 Uncharacterized conserved protein YabE, contains G5 and tandem DUF348 domains [Sanguibacter gelidistatuariae]
MSSKDRISGQRRPVHSPVRRVVQGAVLVALVAATTAFTTMHKTITIEIDGDVRTVSAFGSTVGDVLAGHQVTISAEDVVFPSAASAVSDGDLIVVRTMKTVDLEIDGAPQSIQSTALTVGEVLDEIGPRTDGASVSASRSEALGRAQLKISTVKNVTIAIDGQQIAVVTTQESVRDVLATAGVILNPGDMVSVELTSPAADGQVITIGRAGESATSVSEVLPFTVEEVQDPKLVVGQRIVKQAGKLGQAVTTYDVTLVDGVETARTVVAQQVTVAARNEIVHIGTLELPDPSLVSVDPGTARALGQAMALEKGWGDDQYACLESLWTKESKWSVTAANASSGAYGIPQAMPGSKMASVGADWRTNAATQITWGLGYIQGRYGTPCDAWAHSKNKGWY